MDEDDLDDKKAGNKVNAQTVGEGGNAPAQTLSKNAAKAAKKKAKKERDKLAKEQAALDQAKESEKNADLQKESLEDLKQDVMNIANTIQSGLTASPTHFWPTTRTE